MTAPPDRLGTGAPGGSPQPFGRGDPAAGGGIPTAGVLADWGPPDGPSRPWWKTWLVSVLWTLVPLVGVPVAIQYVQTRNRPATFAPRAALRTAVVWLGCVLATAAVAAAVGFGVAALVGGR